MIVLPLKEFIIGGTNLAQQGYDVSIEVDTINKKLIAKATKPDQTVTLAVGIKTLNSTYPDGAVTLSGGLVLPTAYTIERLAFDGNEISILRVTHTFGSVTYVK